MEHKTDWKQFLQYQPTTQPNQPRRRVKSWPMYIVDVAPGQKEMMYHNEYEAMVAAEKAAKDAQRAARETELASSRPEGRRGDRANPAEPAALLADHRASPPDPAEPAAVLADRRGLPAVAGNPPDFERHSRKCLVCSHPDRDAIEGEFIRWRSPHKIARDYNLVDRNSIYRHAHASGLFEARRRHIGRILESYLETIDDTPPADFDPVTRAVRVYAHLDASGSWVEPSRTLRILTSRSPWPNPDPDEFEANAFPNAAPESISEVITHSPGEPPAEIAPTGPNQ